MTGEIALSSDARVLRFDLSGFAVVEIPEGLGGSRAKHYLPTDAVVVVHPVTGMIQSAYVSAVPLNADGSVRQRVGKSTEHLPSGHPLVQQVREHAALTVVTRRK